MPIRISEENPATTEFVKRITARQDAVFLQKSSLQVWVDKCKEYAKNNNMTILSAAKALKKTEQLTPEEITALTCAQ